MWTKSHRQLLAFKKHKLILELAAVKMMLVQTYW